MGQRGKKLFLARDRMGEKPLYYGNNKGCFFFSSQPKSFKVNPYWGGEIDRDAVALYMRHNAIPAPWSIYKEIKKLLPAHFVVISDYGRCISEPHCYWNLADIAEQGAQNIPANTADLTDELEQLLLNAMRSRIVSDVPLGAFLSGGIDSATVAAFMQAQSSKPIKTFTIGFHEQDYNEAPYANAVAKHLGTEHTELYVSPKEAMAVIPDLASIWDEPFADSSQIPTL